MVLNAALWMVVVGGVVAWVMAYGIGANDVANAFATSVGSHTLKLKWAIVIAAIMETLGAILLGGSVSDTISGGVANPLAFKSTPDVFAYGMMCALTGAAIWLLVATYWELPVSTTHSIVGGVMGFALVYGGPSAVVWNKRISEFPFVSGVLAIVLSWFVSPVLAGLISSALFVVLRTFVLRSKNSAARAIWCLPILLAITIFVNLTFILLTGAKKVIKLPASTLTFILLKGAKKVIKLPASTSLMICGICAVGGAIIGGAIGVPLLFRSKKRWDAVLADHEALPEESKDPLAAVNLSRSKEGSGLPNFLKTIEVDPEDKSLRAWCTRARNALTGGLNADVFACIGEDDGLHNIHASAEKFDPRVEQVFKYLQVISAAAVSFAHGANDVANAVGPFAAIYGIYQTGAISTKSAVEPWMLGGIGSTGIVIGLATWGWRIMRVLGVKMTAITPCRGFTMETTTALVTAFGSYLGIPLSTTQTHVGSTTGVGLSEGRRDAVKWGLLLKMFAGWVFTLFVGAIISGVLFAWGTYAPNISGAAEQNRLAASMAKGMTEMLGALNATGVKDAALAPVLAQLNATMNPTVGVFPSTATSATDLANLMDQTNTIFGRYVRLPAWISRTVG
ncbi:sodium phosphate symporter [Raphidocelis subcapitata]|uniref:Phosphate transporter n=1 Tax=Raphidocelis subcapitata TaxID=307507 RepID=A0A2V0NV68_9CHLO|nr:sodium phosphate symporter [Raphidocelis subcapitata]|eukprot:GBF90572.1 sodium phosphate symporter [Raphidocelis subcapitata]